ncbi:MAG: flagellar assembly peptidoglycan hydrolase FlgJ [Leptothrix sp. (in: b-proteobacteria)]
MRPPSLTSGASGASQTLAAGGGALDALRLSAQKDPKGAIREAAKQFESLFMQELMKSMRATTMSSGMLDNNGTELAGGMLDQQYSQQMSGLPGGLADAIMKQLERQIGGAAAGAATPGPQSVSGALSGLRRPAPAATPAPSSVSGAAAPAGSAGALDASGLSRAEQFVRQHQASAQAVASESGIPASFMLAQAAHETGWGRHQIRQADGTPSNNLFGIKAGANWTGPVAVATTTEVIDGVARKVQARFRAYSSPQESFRDYAQLIGNSPRYEGVMHAGHDATAFAQGLQRAGYATDPDYARKLGGVINTTLRLQRLTV